MQVVLRSLGRVGCNLPCLCQWRRWPAAALVRRQAPVMAFTPAHSDLDHRLSGSSFHKPWRLIPFACGSTKRMDIDHNSTVDDAYVEPINKFPRENFSNRDLDDDDCCEMEDGISVANIPECTSHRDGAIYNNRFLLEDSLLGDINDRNETRLEPMMFSEHPDVYGPRVQDMFQFFSVMLSRSPVRDGSVQLYGYIAVRDERDGMLNYIVNYSRDNPVIVQQGSLIEMTGPKRGILMCCEVLIEFDMRVKMGEHEEEEDLQLIDGALVCWDQVYVPSQPIKQRIIGSSGAAVDVKLAVIGYAVEATIQVVISQVQSDFSLSLSSVLDVCGVVEEIQHFNGLISQPGALRRFVVAVRSRLLLKFVFGNDGTTTNTRQIEFGSKVYGCASRQIRLKAATISVKVTWSSI